MTLPAEPPRYATYAAMLASLKGPEAGWRTYALQAALNAITTAENAPWGVLAADGSWGPLTDAAVRSFQQWSQIAVDGVVGPATQGRILAWCGERASAMQPDIPPGLMRGYAEGEGAGILAATNWSVPGGVDCGPAQFRVYGPPYPQSDLLFAFHPLRALLKAGQDMLERAAVFAKGSWVLAQLPARRPELAVRIAVMAHNWPTAGGADRIAATGKCSSPNDRCTWVVRDSSGASMVKFPDGAPVETRWDWCRHYALGATEHREPGQITKYVTAWT